VVTAFLTTGGNNVTFDGDGGFNSLAVTAPGATATTTGSKLHPVGAITISFAKIKPGQYPYHCVPHLALNMKGVITVQ